MLVILVLPVGLKVVGSNVWLCREVEIPALVCPMSFHLGEVSPGGQRLIADVDVDFEVDSGEAPLIDLMAASRVLYVPLSRQRGWAEPEILAHLEATGWERRTDLLDWLFNH